MKNVLFVLKKVFYGTYFRGFVSSYMAAVIVGASLLKLPISVQKGVNLSWVDALFVSASGLSTTGLTPIVVKDTFTIFGQTVLAFILQFGGIGLIMMVALFWLVVRKKIGFKERNMMMTDQNQPTRQGIVRFVRNVLIVIFTVEAVAFMIMSGYLYLSGYFPFKEALFHSFFTTISLFTNAGFDIAPTVDSFAMFSNDYFMQTLAMTLMFMGAVGFWPLAELKEFIFAKFRRESFQFSFFVKMLVTLHLAVWILSAIILFALERGAFLEGYGFIESVYYSLFMSLTTRNAGFSTMNVEDFTVSTHIFFIFLMFLGSSPNSAGGGIRTTTLFVVLLAMRAFAFDRNQVVTRERSVKQETVHKSFIAIFVAGGLIVVNLFLLTLLEPALPPMILAFEVVSAFGTTGLSLGATTEIAWAAKLVLVITMFIGRVGVIALVLMFRPGRKTKGYVQYPETDIIVG